MKKYSFLYVIMSALLIPMMHAMEKESPINPDSLNQTGRSFIQKTVDEYAEAAQENNITEGAASIFKDIKEEGIEDLIRDQEALKNANITYNELMSDGTKNCAGLFYVFYSSKREHINILKESAQCNNIKRSNF